MLKLVRVDDVKCCLDDLHIERFIELAKEVLSANAVNTPLVVNKDGNVVFGHEVCLTLKKLGVRYLPVTDDVVDRVSISLEVLGFFNDVAPNAMKVFRSTEELLYGNWPTPLVLLKNLSNTSKRVWVKLEGFNPFSMSVKDRIGWYMLKKALEKYGSKIPRLLVEATSTNTGLALASMCAIYGLKLLTYIPSTVSKTGELLLKVFGADVVRSDKPLTVDLIEGVEGVAKELDALHLNQFYNDANFEVHLRYTAKELELQLREVGMVPKAIVGGLGTSGHMSAIALYFKSRFRGIKVYGTVPAVGTSIQGIRRVESGMKWVHMVELDGVVDVYLEEAVSSVLELARREGILVGLSSGAVYAAYKKITDEVGDGDYILIFPDHGFKYVEQLMKYL